MAPLRETRVNEQSQKNKVIAIVHGYTRKSGLKQIKNIRITECAIR